MDMVVMGMVRGRHHHPMAVVAAAGRTEIVELVGVRRLALKQLPRLRHSRPKLQKKKLKHMQPLKPLDNSEPRRDRREWLSKRRS